jgi:hypothetical protein
MADPTRAELERAIIAAIEAAPLGTIEQWNDMGPHSVLGALGRAACALRKMPACREQSAVHILREDGRLVALCGAQPADHDRGVDWIDRERATCDECRATAEVWDDV